MGTKDSEAGRLDWRRDIIKKYNSKGELSFQLYCTWAWKLLYLKQRVLLVTFSKIVQLSFKVIQFYDWRHNIHEIFPKREENKVCEEQPRKPNCPGCSRSSC